MDVAGYTKPAKVVQNAVLAYQRARVAFIDTMHDLASKNEEFILASMLDVGVLTLLCSPLLHDPFPGVQIPALSTLSKLAGKVGGIAGAVTEMGVLEMLLKAMWHSNRGVRKAANTAMQSVASAGEECAEACVHCGALDAIHASVQNYDADVTEEAVKTLSIILTTKQDLTGVAMTEQLTACLVNLLGAGGICPNLKNLAASLIGNMCAHSEELAERARGLNALTELAGVARDLGAPQKLRSTALGSLSQAAAHSDSLTVAVLKTRVLPAALAALTDPSPGMRKSSSVLLQSIVQKSAEMADAVDKSGGIPCLVANVIEDGRNGAALSAVLSLGHMAAFRHTYAQRIVSADGGRVLANQLHGCEVAPTSPSGRSIPTEEVDTFKQAIAWTLMQIGCQGKDLAERLAYDGALGALLAVYTNATSSPELRQKCKKGLKAIIQRCDGVTSALTPLVRDTTPPEILQHVLSSLLKGLASEPGASAAKRSFVTSGALMHLMRIRDKFAALQRSLPESTADRPGRNSERDIRHMECIMADVETVAAMFPLDVVSYYTKS